MRSKLTPGVCIIALVAIAQLARPAAAQTVNPTRAVFEASPDHTATDGSGLSIVQLYSLQFYLAGATAPFQSVSLDRPDPDETGTITVDLTGILMGWPVPGISYFATVAASGPGGTTTSEPSNTFISTAPTTCEYITSPHTVSAGPAGGDQTASVVTQGVCAWNVASNTGWISVIESGTRIGTEDITFNVAVNPTPIARTGTLTLATQTLTVAQSGVACVFTLSPTSQSVPGSGGSRMASVTTLSGCAWSATSNANWITVTGGSSGSGSGTVTYNAAANPSATQRTGTLTAAGRTLTVVEAGSLPPSAPAGARIVQ